MRRSTEVDGARLSYLEGPANGKPPLLLIHGQGVDATDYSKLLPRLATTYHVFVVDCFGHGESAHDPRLYSAKAHGQALATFLRQTVRRPVVVSGHSSGGVLAAWLAGNAPDTVAAALLEDPPLFTTQLPRARTTWNYVDLATTAHGFVTSHELDWPAYWWPRQRMWQFFGNSAKPLIDAGQKHRRQHPDQPISVWYVPQFEDFTRPMEHYDPRFGDAFYTGSWDTGFDLPATLRAIKAPTILVHTKVAYDKDGTLMAAMGEEEAARARGLIRQVEFVKVETGHGFHGEDSDHYLQLVESLAKHA